MSFACQIVLTSRIHIGWFSLETVKLAYYNINKCGYYKFGQDEPEFGGVTDVLADIKEWISDKSLRGTKVFDPRDGENLFPVYIHDLQIDPATGDALLITWNETPTTQDGHVAAAAGDDPVGSVEVSLMEVPEGGIPGFPCFFYFLPSKSIVIAIRFDGQTHTAQPALARYMSEFMAKFSSHVVLSEEGDEIQIAGYTQGERSAVLQNVRPHYKTSVARMQQKIQWLKENCASIRKLVRRDHLSIGVAAHYTRLQAIWSWLGIAQPAPPVSGSVNFDFQMDCSIDEAEFDQLVAFEEQEHNLDNNIGFMMKGDNTVYWLSHALVKQEIEIDAQRTDAGLVNTAELLAAMGAKRQAILAILD